MRRAACGRSTQGRCGRARELEALQFVHMVVQPVLGTGYQSAFKVLEPG